MQRSRLPRFLQRLRFSQILGLLFTLLLSIKLLTACTPQQVTLSFVVPNEEIGQWNSLIDDFREKHPNIEIKIRDKKRPEEVEKVYTDAFEKKSPYDLVYMDIIWVSKFAAQGWLENLSIPEEEFLDGDVRGGKYDEKLYRIPFRSDVSVLYYRKSLLNQAKEELPETFEDLLRIAQTVKEQKNLKFGYLWHGEVDEGLSAMFLEVLQGYGGFWIRPAIKQVGLAQQPAKDAVTLLRRTINGGISPRDFASYTDDTIRNYFRNGKAVFMRDWPIFWSEANAADSPIRGDIGIMPMVHAKGYRSYACQGGWGLGIASNSKHKKQARTAIEFFTSAAAQRKFVLNETYLPSRKALFYDPHIVDRHTFYPKLLEVTQYPALRPSVPNYDKVSKILQKYLSAALNAPSNSEADNQMEMAAKKTRQELNY